MARILNLAAAGAGEIAAEERFEHEHDGETLAALQLLANDVAGHRPHLRYGNAHAFECNLLKIKEPSGGTGRLT